MPARDLRSGVPRPLFYGTTPLTLSARGRCVFFMAIANPVDASDLFSLSSLMLFWSEANVLCAIGRAHLHPTRGPTLEVAHSWQQSVVLLADLAVMLATDLF